MDLTGTRPDIAQKMKEFMESKRNKDGTAVSAAFMKDGELIAAFACGTQDGNAEKPATVHDLYNIGSVSKVYCALAVMKLVEMDKVILDMPVVEYLPRFTMKDGRYKQITLRMCLNHSSGLPGVIVKNRICEKWLDESITYDQFYDYLAKSMLKADPGDFSVYCNDGFTLAELVVSEVSGMSYIRFLQEYITKPANAPSTCSGGSIPDNRSRIREKGKPDEYLMHIGAGGILTDMADCAKVGSLFIDPKKIFKIGILDETTRPQGKSFIPNFTYENLGLGWDCVNYTNGAYDLGWNTLVKDGSTLSFGSFLLVSKKHNLSAAISLTSDNKVNYQALLCDLCAILLDEYNINIRGGTKKEAHEAVKTPVPIEYSEKYSGIYYNNMAIFCVSFDDDMVSIQSRDLNGDGWNDYLSGGDFDGRRFFSGEMSFAFEEHRGNMYYIMEWLPERYPMAQKRDNFPPLNEVWKSRIGKKYLVCDANPTEYFLTDLGTALTIREFEQEGVLCFINKGGNISRSIPAIQAGERETDMFLDAPGLGSRDGFAPFIYEENNIMYLYACGYTYIDTVFLSPLQTGRIVSEKGEQNRIYSITAGHKLNIDIPAGVRVVMLNYDLSLNYDSRSGQNPVETCDGFILFINEVPMNLFVEVCI
ncbi:MAG TPA: serine hydrolase [Clostridia bacterium]|nr:serine hydrolase [Clostridia bacterium]